MDGEGSCTNEASEKCSVVPLPTASIPACKTCDRSSCTLSTSSSSSSFSTTPSSYPLPLTPVQETLPSPRDLTSEFFGQDGGGIMMRRIPSQIRLAIMSLNRDQTVWEEMEDDLYILLDGKVESLNAFRDLFFEMHMSKSSLLLRSLAYLCSAKAHDISIHDEHVSRIAGFLSTGRGPRSLKLAALKTLMLCVSPKESTWQTKDEVIEGTFSFLITRSQEWEYYEHSAMTLIYELRAKCLRELDMEYERIRRVVDKGDEAAVLIATGAKLVEIGIHKSNKVIEGQIDNAGKKMKGWVEADANPLITDRDAIVAMAFSDAAKRASVCAREGTKAVLSTFCDASISGLHTVGNKLGERKFVENLSPEGRGILKAAGKVGMATVGAAAIVGEAMVETSRGVVSRTAGVTAEVVGHKYGTTAGKVAKNTAETAENVVRTMTDATLMEGTVLAKFIAKNVGKDQIEKDFEKAKETISLLEKHVSGFASRTLGIEWQGNWMKEIGAETTAENRDDSEPTSATVDKNTTKHDDKSQATNDVIKSVEDVTKESDTCTSKLAQGNEDHSASDTSSLSSSVSTERSAYRIARRGKPSQRKRAPLRPDADLPPVSTSFRRKSHPSRRLSHQRYSRMVLTPTNEDLAS
mmetsp:Transcript_283/g.480  ORF Transcript_283/g.480 Transcript_283/m.480 type:complete len:636 (-) Transcript_283:1232-3139(-)